MDAYLPDLDKTVNLDRTKAELRRNNSIRYTNARYACARRSGADLLRYDADRGIAAVENLLEMSEGRNTRCYRALGARRRRWAIG